MAVSRAIGQIRRLPLLLVFVFLILPAHARGDSQSRISVSIGVGGFFGVPVHQGFGGFYYPAQYPPGIYVPPPSRPYYAFVDTDIHPEKAEVYLDGRLIGIADDFDGYPGYLAVKPGRHTLVFRYPGRHSLSFDLNLHAGELVDLDQKLPKLGPGEPEEPPPPPPRKTAGEKPAPPRSDEGTGAKRGSYGTLRLEIAPPDARVTLDGDHFGTGAEISRLHGGIPLAPGMHRIRVTRAGYESESMETEIHESEERTLRISLHKQ